MPYFSAHPNVHANTKGIASMVKSEVDAQRAANESRSSAAIIDMGTSTIIIPVNTGPHPYQGSDPHKAGQISIPSSSIASNSTASSSTPILGTSIARTKPTRKHRKRRSWFYRAFVGDNKRAPEEGTEGGVDSSIDEEIPRAASAPILELGPKATLRNVRALRTASDYSIGLRQYSYQGEVVLAEDSDQGFET